MFLYGMSVSNFMCFLFLGSPLKIVDNLPNINKNWTPSLKIYILLHVLYILFYL